MIDAVAATAIDGVSLGGRMALLSGLYQPAAFGSVGTLQAAFDSSDATKLASLAVQAKAANPTLKFRLLTSEDDYFLHANQAISAAFRQAHVEHQFVVIPGPHDYALIAAQGSSRCSSTTIEPFGTRRYIESRFYVNPCGTLPVSEVCASCSDAIPRQGNPIYSVKVLARPDRYDRRARIIFAAPP